MNVFKWAFLNKRNDRLWKAFSNKERHFAIYEVENVVCRYGFITDFHMFSDMELSLKIETDDLKIEKLYHDLNSCLTFSGPAERFDPGSGKECTILLNITFVKSTGNLKIEVPSVPG